MPSKKPIRSAAADPGGYIAGLDGLRALAVAAVMLYHVAPGVFPGGFLGVDIFFVISGFLITALLLREFRANRRLDLPRFWLRRARRLLPAFVVLILVVVPLAWLIETDLLVGIRRQVLGALTFSTNWLEIAHGSSYFDQTAPLLFKNFWSLAIEEQFYLFWPLALLLILAFLPRWDRRIIVSGALALISIVLMAVLYRPDAATRVYYGTDTHLFGLAIGITLAFLWSDPRAHVLGARGWERTRSWAGITALAALIAEILFLSDTNAFAYRGGMAIASLLTAIIIAAMIAPASRLARIADSAPLRWIGTRSYGLYLWHWPILVLATAAVPVAVGGLGFWVRAVIAIALTGLFTELSYRYIETPIRRDGFRATYHRIATALRPATAYPPKVAAGVALIALAATAGALAVAPQQTKAAAAIAAAEAELAQNKAEGFELAKISEWADAPAWTTLPEDFNASAPAAEEITAIGDSMVTASKTGLESALPRINFAAQSSQKWSDAPAMIQAAKDDGTLRRAVLLHFGTNAGVQDASELYTAINMLGAERMIMIANLYSPSTFVDDSNGLIAKVANEYPNVVLMDWHALAAAQPELLQVDQTHTSIEGANAYGNLVAQTFADFAASL